MALPFTITQISTYSYDNELITTPVYPVSIYTYAINSAIPSWLSVGSTNPLSGITTDWSYYLITAPGQYVFVFTEQPTEYGFTVVSNGGVGGSSNDGAGGGGGGGNGQIFTKMYDLNTTETITINIYPNNNTDGTYDSTHIDSSGITTTIFSGHYGEDGENNSGGGNGGGKSTTIASNGGILYGGGGGGGGVAADEAGIPGGNGGYGSNPNAFISFSGIIGSNSVYDTSTTDYHPGYGGFTICQCGDGTTRLIAAGDGGGGIYDSGEAGYPACILLYVA